MSDVETVNAALRHAIVLLNRYHAPGMIESPIAVVLQRHLDERMAGALTKTERDRIVGVVASMRQIGNAVFIKAEQSLEVLGYEHVATRSLDFAAAQILTWADALEAIARAKPNAKEGTSKP